jgi:hypothetical protein
MDEGSEALKDTRGDLFSAFNVSMCQWFTDWENGWGYGAHRGKYPHNGWRSSQQRFGQGVITAVLRTFNCDNQNTSSPASLRPSVTPSVTKIASTSTATLVEEATATSTLDDTPTLTITSTPPATWTPYPKMAVEETMQTVVGLLKGNERCLLPCWWGIISGETRWSTIQAFLNSLASKNSLLQNSG